jgi:hypothetical protein
MTIVRRADGSLVPLTEDDIKRIDSTGVTGAERRGALRREADWLDDELEALGHPVPQNRGIYRVED